MGTIKSEVNQFPEVSFRFLLPVPFEWASLEHVETALDDDLQAWLPVKYAPLYLEKIVNNYLAKPSLTCCSFQGGFVIWVDEQCWNDYTVDEFSMTMHWYLAYEELLKQGGQAKTTTWVWEESSLNLQRAEDSLLMYEERYALFNSCLPVTVNFWEVGRQLVSEGRYYVSYIQAIQQLLATYYPLEPLRQVDQVFKENNRAGNNSSAITQAEKLSQVLVYHDEQHIAIIEQLADLLETQL
jgi:hypothetical protein